MKYKTYTEIIVGFAENLTIDMYKLYKPETKRVITIRDIMWVECKNNDPEENMNMFHNLN